MSGFISLNVFSQAPNYAPKEFYLIDSLDLNLLSAEDKYFVDSCLTLYHASAHDTVKIQAIMTIVDNVWNNDVWPVYNRYVLNRLVNSLSHNAGNTETRFWKKKLAETINNEGYYYRSIGNVPVALQYYHESLKLLEELHDTLNMGILYNNLGVIYQHQRSFNKALEYHFKSLELKSQTRDSLGMAHTNNNIGVIYTLQDSMALSLTYFQRSLADFLKYNDPTGFARSYYNLGNSYRHLDSLDKSKAYYLKSLESYEALRHNEGISLTCSGLGLLELKMGNILEAKKYGEYGLNVAFKLGNPENIASNASLLYQVSKREGDWKTALEMRNLEIQMRDSVLNTKSIQQSADTEAKYQYEKQQAIKDIEHRAEIEKQQSISESDKKRQNTVIIAVSAGFVVVVIFAFFLNNRIRVTRKQKKIIEEQKHEVEEKNKEILDSIRYAKRIQNAILPSMEAMQNELKKGFVLYKPKDVVAGDFYWLEKIDSRVYFAAADCTGHGVPGAMVSVVCSNALSKALLEENANSTGDLFDKTRDIVIGRLAKSGEEMKDGMDISLCAIDFEKMELQWSGANNPLWIVRENELIEYKADKQPVGVHSAMKNFTTHQIQLLKGDKIYLMTDGFQDQFGGAQGKKFKAAQLKEILLQCKNEDMNRQKVKLENAFENWKKGIEQIDDVCMIGVEI
ncbi:MAG: tetratricopeptide repeat protein [Crocinitomicaceae bacterium]|nr:tetratricopeptide repeat protein [Crocinitomicaceae bacterium]